MVYVYLSEDHIYKRVQKFKDSVQGLDDTPCQYQAYGIITHDRIIEEHYIWE
jgi:hypothetical protein